MNTRQTIPAQSFTRRDILRLFGFAGAAAAFGPVLLRGDGSVPASTTTASLGGQLPALYPFRIGEYEALAIRDGGMAPAVAECPFGIGEPRERIAEALREAFLPTDNVQIPFNILLVRMGSELVMVDAGCGFAYGAPGGRLLTNLAAAGIKPEQITAIILTHAHGDHFGGLLDQNDQPVFKNARLFTSRTEHDFWMGSAPDLSNLNMPPEARTFMTKSAQKYLGAFKGRWEFVRGGDKLFGGIEFIDAAGHTPGHLAVLFSSGSEKLLHFADIAHHHVLSFAHPEWVIAFDANPKPAITTRRKLMERAAAERLRVFGSHMAFPSLGHVRKAGAGFEFVIEPSSAV